MSNICKSTSNNTHLNSVGRLMSLHLMHWHVRARATSIGMMMRALSPQFRLMQRWITSQGRAEQSTHISTSFSVESSSASYFAYLFLPSLRTKLCNVFALMEVALGLLGSHRWAMSYKQLAQIEIYAVSRGLAWLELRASSSSLSKWMLYSMGQKLTA